MAKKIININEKEFPLITTSVCHLPDSATAAEESAGMGASTFQASGESSLQAPFLERILNLVVTLCCLEGILKLENLTRQGMYNGGAMELWN